VNDDHFEETFPDPNVRNEFTTSISVGVLGLLWCTDTQEDKAHFLWKLINPHNDLRVAWSDKELKTVINKLFYFSNELVS
jgi:hypothetical protein